MIWFQFQVNALIKTKDEQIERLKTALDLETLRANKAIDQLLNQAHVAGLVPAPQRPRADIDEILKSVKAAARVGQDIEGTDHD